MADIIKSYMVSLTAGVDKASFDKFQSALGGAEKSVASSVGSMAGKMLAFEIAGVSAFASVGFGLIGYIDKLAMADAAMRRTAQQNMMSVQQWRGLQNALDAVGLSMDNAMAWTPEDLRRFHAMSEHSTQLEKMLGGDNYEDKMMQVRKVIDQVSMLEMDAKYFGMMFVSDLLGKLGFGQDGILIQMQHLGDYIMGNMPKWSTELSTSVIPYLSDLWHLLKDVWVVAGEAEVGFVHLMGELSGNDALRNSAGGFGDLATSIGILAHEFGVILEILPKIAVLIPPLVEMIVDSMTGAVELMSGHPFKAHDDFKRASAVGETLKGDMGSIKDWFAANPFKYTPQASTDFSQLFQMPETTNDDFGKLVHGVAMVESGNRQFDAAGNIIYGQPNKTGELAVGRMQILPSTAKMLGVDPYDDAQNLAGGEKYLRQLLARHRGNVAGALADYGGFKSQYTPDAQKYISKVESQGGLSIGTIIIQSSPNLTPDQHTHVVQKAIGKALNDHFRQQILETNGAYAQ